MKKLGVRIKNLREKANINQKEFAKKIGVSNVVLSRYESGERNPDYETLLKIAQYFEVSTDELLGHSLDNSLSTENSKDAAFEAFRNDPNLEVFYKELPESDEEKVQQLKDFWEFINKKKWDMSNRVFYFKYTWQYFSLLELYRYIRMEETYGLYF